ncbi:MAG TPA: hypothetical protein VFW45_12350, partial [Candidatus Polarisedimenticolia bacterium]|nr:hypothetical protein [Candidatus Polarisedimenticolia bacterium]
FFAKAGAIASTSFTIATGQTPSQFGRGMLDKAMSITVDPVKRTFMPNGMMDKAAQKAVDKLMGINKPDDAYVTKEEHKQQLRDIATIVLFLFPGMGEACGIPTGGALATPEGVVLQVPAAGVAAPSAGATTVAKIGSVTSTGVSGGSTKPTPPKPKEPGQLLDDFTAGENMKPEQAKYQKQVTGQNPKKSYYVKGRSFDAYEHGKGGKPGTLVEAKHLGDEGRFARAYENMNKGDFRDLEHLVDRAEKILDQARAQVKVAEGTGARIEWRVSGENATRALKKLFDNDPSLKGRIDVVHVPMKK